MARLSAHLGINMNTTPVEDKKDNNQPDKSPMMGRNNSRLNNLNKSLNTKNKLNSSIPMIDSHSMNTKLI